MMKSTLAFLFAIGLGAASTTGALADNHKHAKGAKCEHCGKASKDCKKCKGKKKCTCKTEVEHDDESEEETTGAKTDDAAID